MTLHMIEKCVYLHMIVKYFYLHMIVRMPTIIRQDFI